MAQDDLPALSRQSAPMRVIAIASGKGGVGKTNVTTNLSVSLAMQGQRVSVIDADTGLGNLNILLNIKPKFTLEHLLNGDKELHEILAEGPHGIQIIPAASGITELANLKKNQLQRLIKSLRELERDFDYLLIDTAAGISRQVLQFIQSAKYTVVVITPEPTSMTDGFALIRALQNAKYKQPIYILVNMVHSFALSIETYKRFEATVRKYLTTQVHYLGYVPEDDVLKQAVCAQQPVLLHDPGTPASRSFITIAHAINRHFHSSQDDYDFASFWEQNLAVKEKVAEAKEARAEPAQIADKPAPAETNQIPAQQAATPQSAASLIKQLATTELSEKQLHQLTQVLINTSIQRFRKLPFAINEQVYRALEINGFREEEIRHLVRALRSLYQKSHNEPLEDPEQAIIEEFTRLGGEQDKMQDVIQQLQHLYQERCKSEKPANKNKLELPASFSTFHQGNSDK